LVRLASDGSLRWARHYAGSVSYDAEFFGAGIALYGSAYAADLGAGKPLKGAILAELGADGQYLWSHTLEDAQMDYYGYGGAARGEVLDGSGQLVIFNAHRIPSAQNTPDNA